ncbi:MAG: ABA4-like family protein [Sediminibacterium sp.]
MTPSEIFSISNSVIFIGWILLIILPKWKYTQSIILNGLLVVFSILYSFLLFKDIGELSADSFGTLAKLKLLFQSDTAVLAGWVHYLIFDLFVGAYIVRKSIEIELPRIIYTCILPFALMCGPIGYLIFVIVKTFKAKTLIEVN